MSQPFFSIIIPTLNEQYFLPLLLKDLKNQTFQNFEVIVVDGNSKDKTQQFAKNSKSKLLLSHKKNVSYQRNLGAKNAKGKYLIFFDADVEIPKYFLKKLHLQLLEKPVDLFSSKLMLSNSLPENILIIIGNLLYSFSSLIKKPIFGGFFIGCNKFSFQKIGGFNKNMYMCEDHKLCEDFIKNNYSYKLFNEPRFIMSFRRFHHEGFIKVLYKWTKSTIYYIFGFNLNQKIVDYNMGGGSYSNKSQK